MRGRQMSGNGFGGNLFPYCRHNPDLPSRRAMEFSGLNPNHFRYSEEEYLKDTAARLQSRLDYINQRINSLEEK